MKHLVIAAAAIALLTGPAANAQPGNRNNGPAQAGPQQGGPMQGGKMHDGQWHEQSGQRDNGRHLGWGRNRGTNNHWMRGQQMGYDDWRNAARIDYRRYRLRQPPGGYEWRRTDDRYILASTTTGRIISVILANRR